MTLTIQPAHQWLLNEGSFGTASDSNTTTPYNLTPFGTPTSVAGIMNNAAQADGINNGLEAAMSSTDLITNSNPAGVSMSVWLKSTSNGFDFITAMGFYEINGNIDYFDIYVGDGRFVGLGITTDDNNTQFMDIKNFADGTYFDDWMHICVVADLYNKKAIGYLNGKFAVSIDLTTSKLAIPSQPLVVGKVNFALSNSGDTWAYDQALWFDAPLTEADAFELWANGTPTQEDLYSSNYPNKPLLLNSSVIHHWKLDDPTPSTTCVDSVGSLDLAESNNDLSSEISGKFGSAVSFPGTNAAQAIARNTSPGNIYPANDLFSFELWFNMDTIQPRGDTGIPFPRVIDSKTDNDGFIFISAPYLDSSDNNKLALHGNYDSGPNNVAYTINDLRYVNGEVIDILPGEWRHMICTYDGHVLHLYLDGIQVRTGTFSSAYTVSIDNTVQHFALGGAIFDDLALMDGNMDNVKMYNKCLSSEEVAVIYESSNNNFETAVLIEDSNSQALGMAVGNLENNIKKHYTGQHTLTVRDGAADRAGFSKSGQNVNIVDVLYGNSDGTGQQYAYASVQQSNDLLRINGEDQNKTYVASAGTLELSNAHIRKSSGALQLIGRVKVRKITEVTQAITFPLTLPLVAP